MIETQSLTIRRINASDKAQWSELWRAYLGFYNTVLPDETHNTTFQRMIAGDQSMYGLMAMDAGKAIGLVHYLTHQDFWKPTPSCYLQDLFTAPEARGKGVARALMQAVFKDAAAIGIADVYWLTAETNYLGRTLYDRVGVKTPFIVYQRSA
jgi:GNAT superfamily N-acetyltransferase